MTYSEAIEQILSDLDSAETRLNAMLQNAGELSRPEILKSIGVLHALQRFLLSAQRFLLHENLIDEDLSE